MALLEQEERQRVKGLIINKFRGDRSILDPGAAMLEQLCGIPVIGVVPYMDVDIEDEDSLSARLENGQASGLVDLAVIRLPRISNFTDFNVFSRIPGVSLRYVSRVSELGTPDLVFLPGTKNTMDDLLWMRQNGLEAAVLKLAHKQVPIWGICGGYQMMGEVLRDAGGVESADVRETAGMGLLPLCTDFQEEKVRTQVEGSLGELDGVLAPLSGQCISGYEIHMGRTAIDRENGAMDTAMLVSWRREPVICRPVSYVMEIQDKDRPGCDGKRVKEDGWNRGNIYGAYIHGIFDHPGIAETIVSSLAAKKGISMDEVKAGDYSAYRQQQYDKLADVLRSSLDMDAIYKMMGL